MITTLESVELLDQAESLAKMVLHSDVAQRYRQRLYILQQDRDAQALIAEFAKMKERFEEVQRFGKYHPDYTEVSRKMRTLKRELDLQDVIADFKQSENELQKLLDEVSVIIGQEISPSIKVPTGNPFFDSMSSCGGGCGSGGGCGCK